MGNVQAVQPSKTARLAGKLYSESEVTSSRCDRSCRETSTPAMQHTTADFVPAARCCVALEQGFQGLQGQVQPQGWMAPGQVCSQVLEGACSQE